MRSKILLLCLFFLSVSVCAQIKPSMRAEDKIRIRSAMHIANMYGDSIWAGFSKTPFTIILVTDSVEFLLNHENPSPDFVFLENDEVVQSKVYYRKTQFNKHFLATFPAVNGVNCIVVGTPENTGLTSSEWVVTLLHEHFHQYVYSSPGYYQSVDSLDLSGGDKTGMWMLNFPFCYESDQVNTAYAEYTKALLQAVSVKENENIQAFVEQYKQKRLYFEQSLQPNEYRYFSFQLWQEGVARYTEYKFLELLKHYLPDKEVQSLPDFIPFDKYYTAFYSRQLQRVTSFTLADNKRECLYALGLAEGILLDKLNPAWRKLYLTKKFYLEKYR